jgi:catechol 2,3-dioxygenase-like lactoylglutathione lyase family enzyme
MIKGLAHVCFHVRDLEAAEAFYTGKLGFRRAFDFHNAQGKRIGTDLHISGRNFLELFRSEVTPPQPAQGYRHLCLEVDDMAATRADLLAKGIEVTEPKKGSEGSWQAWLKDLEGNTIELHCYTAESKELPWMK